ASTNPKLSAIIGTGWDAEADAGVECRHSHGGTENGFPGGEFQVVIKVGASHAEVRMRRQPHTQVKVSRYATARGWLTLPWSSNDLALLDTGGNADFDGVSFCLASAWIDPLQGDGAHRAMHRFVEGDENITFDVAA